MPAPRKTTNYLNNKDILKEIHKSKTSYCYFTKKDYHQFDLITDLDLATEGQSGIEKSLTWAVKPEQIQQAKENKAARLSAEQGLTGKNKIDPATIETDGLMFRVMTWDHIPVAQKQPRKVVKKKKAADIIDFGKRAANLGRSFS